MSRLGVVPAELCARPQWVAWRHELGDGEPTKVPYRPDGLGRASTTDPATWGLLEDALLFVSTGEYVGVGYVFSADDPYAGVDFDDCYDWEAERLHPDVGALVCLLDSYTEISPSGRGVKTIVRAGLNGFPRNRTGQTGWGGDFEVYDQSRYFTITAKHLRGTPTTVESRQAKLGQVLEFVFGPMAAPKDTPAPIGTGLGGDDAELLERARAADNGAKFDRLWGGDWGEYGSRSEADLALCGLLAFWTGPNQARIDTLFRRSGLMRDKWDERRGESTYGAQTMERALAGRTEFYSTYRPSSVTAAPSPSVPTYTVDGAGLDGAAVLDEAAGGFRRYVVAGPEAVDAVALWCAHTYCYDVFELSPLLPFSSPVERSGKTTAMKVLRELVRNPWAVITPSEAVVFRKIARDRPTVLLDEYDAIFAQKEQEPLRAILNAGNEPDTKVPRCVGPRLELVDFAIFCPKALAGIGRLPRTVDDRSIKIKLKRKASGERARKFRRREAREFLAPVRDRLAAWVEANRERVGSTYPELPEGLNDRAEDCWEPLVAIADVAGGDWPQRARAAAIALSTESDDEDEHARGVVLLAAIRQVFDRLAVDRISTVTLIEQLGRDDESPFVDWWDDDRGKPDKGAARKLAGLLRPFEIRSKTVRIDEKTPKGFEREQFEDAFVRYPAPESTTSATTVYPSQKAPKSNPQQELDVADFKTASTPHEQRDVADVADSEPPNGAEVGRSAQATVWQLASDPGAVSEPDGGGAGESASSR